MVCERLEHSFKRRLAVDSKKQSPARLAQSVERKALNLVVVDSIPTVGDLRFAPPWEVAKRESRLATDSPICLQPM